MNTPQTPTDPVPQETARLQAAADRLDAKAAALLEGLEDCAAFVAKARQHDARIWQEAAAEVRAILAGEQPNA